MINKIIACVILACCLFATAFFANRTLFAIVALVLLFQILSRSSLSRKAARKAVFTAVAFVGVCSVLLLSVRLNLGGLGADVANLKIIQRFAEEGGGRFEAWGTFVSDANFLKYPFGGGYISDLATHGYLHNMWLDVYDVAGFLPFVILVIFSCMSIKNILAYRRSWITVEDRNDSICFTCLMVAVALNCMVEPIIEGNPYFFLAVLIFLGAMDAQTRRLSNRRPE